MCVRREKERKKERERKRKKERKKEKNKNKNKKEIAYQHHKLPRCVGKKMLKKSFFRVSPFSSLKRL